MGRKLTARKGGIGEPSSKYGYDRNGEQFDRDIAEAAARFEALWNDFVKFMQDRNVDPRTLRRLFIRYLEEFFAEGQT